MHTITVSVVSHAQATLVEKLVADLAALSRRGLQIVLTLNVPEELPSLPSSVAVDLIRNPSPKGFGANHNAAFRLAKGELFCVVNPDIRLDADPFGPLAAELAEPKVGVAAPLVVNANGELEDSARRF